MTNERQRMISEEANQRKHGVFSRLIIKSIAFTSCCIKIANLILKTIIKLGTKGCNPCGLLTIFLEEKEDPSKETCLVLNLED
jgi:hypothetical protein